MKTLCVILFTFTLLHKVVLVEDEEASVDIDNSDSVSTVSETQEAFSNEGKTDLANINESNLTNGSHLAHNGSSNSSLKIKPVCTSESGCSPSLQCLNMTTINDTNTTDIVNQGKVVKVISGQLQYLLENPLYTNSCLLVLFYAVWCPYSIEFIPMFNVLGKQFPQLPVLALDFGAEEPEKFLLAYLPRALLYYSGRAVYNIDTSMSRERLTQILANMTGHLPSPISEEDLESINSESPLPLEWEFESTWYKLSVVVVLVIITVHILKRTSCCNCILQCRNSMRNFFEKLKRE